MPPVTTTTKFDMALEEHGLRKQGMLGRGKNQNKVFSIDFESLPPEARTTYHLIIAGGPFPYPGKDGSPFGNKFGDLPTGRYLEYTVPTPNVVTRGARRLVVRKSTAQAFFTAVHYERVGAQGGNATQRAQAMKDETANVDEEWRNGFYIVTGLSADLRAAFVEAIKKLP